MTDTPDPQPEPQTPAWGSQPAPYVPQPAASQVLDPETRRSLLAQAVANHVRQGSRVESQLEFQAVMVKGSPINHTFHLIATLVTCGMWGIVWLCLLGLAGENRYALRVDEYGNILEA